MRADDVRAMREAWPRWAARMGEVRTVALLSPSEEERLLREKVWPAARTQSFLRDVWDLDRDEAPGEFDVVVASSVFMFSPDPAAWMRRVLARCRFFLFQDNVMARRDRSGEFGTPNDDGIDQRRFSVLPTHPTRVPSENSYDLPTELGDRLLDVVVYPCFNGSGPKAEDVVALIRGDLP